MTNIRVGQVWADNDPRSEGRTLRVERIDGDKAVCAVLTAIGGGIVYPGSPKTVRISLRRFKPTSTGYRLVSESK